MNTNDGPPSREALPFAGLLIDLGRQRRKQIERLKGGKGALTHQIRAAVDQLRDEFALDPMTEIVPVVLLYRRRRRSDYVVIVPEGR